MKKLKLMKNLKYIIPCLILIGILIFKIFNVTFSSLPGVVTVEDSNIVSELEKAKDENSMLTIKGSDNDSNYEFFYDKGSITSTEETNLEIIFVSKYDEQIKETLGVTSVKGFKFHDDVVLNGYPTLTIELKNWDALDCEIYKLSNNRLFQLTTPAINKEGNIVTISYPVRETGDIYFVVAGFGLANAQRPNSTYNKTIEDKEQGSKESTIDSKTFNNTSAKNATNGAKNTYDTKKNTTTESKNNADAKIETSKVDESSYKTDIKPASSGEPITSIAKKSERKLSDGSQTGKDKYETDPVPIGKPLPIESEDVVINKNMTYKCTLSIEVKTILNNKKLLSSGKEKYVPADGWILKTKEVIFYDGESVYDVLKRELEKAKIHMESSWTAIYNSVYIEGINNLYEFDCGNLSGWMYSVNGWFPNYGASRYQLQDSDVICWRYTCDLGADIGCYMGSQE